VEERERSRLKRTGEQKRLPVLDVEGAVKSVAEVLTQEEVERYAEQRKEE
jgi:hypothetical protein